MCCMLASLEKYVLIVTSIIFFVCGIGLVCAGVASLVKFSDILDIIPIDVNSISIFIIVLGCVVFAFSFCGLLGAIKESRWLLFVYSVCMIALAAGKIYLATVIFKELADIKERAEGWVTDAFRAANNESFHQLEVAFRCCGTTGPASYNGTLPLSCCLDLPQDSTECLVQDAFSDGCIISLGSYIRTLGDAVGVILIMIILYQILAAAFGLYIHCSPKYRKEKK